MYEKFYTFLAQITVNDATELPRVQATESTLKSSLELVIMIAGAVSLLIITIAGLQYIISQGDSQKVANAKNAIIYAAVGLAVCVLSYGIVQFVVDRV